MGLSVMTSSPVVAQDTREQYIPLPTYRVGPYASSGLPIWGGLIDYFRYVNEVEGGINGVKLVWDECETGYDVGKGIECYERMKGGKDGSPTAIFMPLSDPLSQALVQRSREDKIPMMTPGFGLTESVDGSVFPYSFPVVLTSWSEVSSVVNFIAEKAGGKDKLKGMKIASLYHDSPYGKETQTPMAMLAEEYGFEDIQIPVPHPGNDQSAQWAKIRQSQPDWVYLRGWGVMTPVAIKTAAKVGFPVDHIVGGTWSTSEEDVRPAGRVGVGYYGATPWPSGTDYEILKNLKAKIVDKGLSDLNDTKSFGTVYYNMGVLTGVLVTEALRTAYDEFGARTVTGEEMQWGIEHMQIDDARLAEIGATGLLQPLSMSMKDHEGGGASKILQWDGEGWVAGSESWVDSDRDLLLPKVYEKAAAYAAEQGIMPRTEGQN
ncbi:ABC transporter substrate-binding protein [Hoeflea sp. Naph1]|uniref:ABC transporter substrate-binding protein n=1 Tax=Hoeflea sp. Naph1 TaxID=3388653 RepID=UPI003990227E